ncbi:hypothetical protein BC831DRAFT_462418 [Entophlyctis helioformis]|nr:hypothetical protein BC831DRAFT_462418 [Entophlyctis helioformis]
MTATTLLLEVAARLESPDTLAALHAAIEANPQLLVGDSHAVRAILGPIIPFESRTARIMRTINQSIVITSTWYLHQNLLTPAGLNVKDVRGADGWRIVLVFHRDGKAMTVTHIRREESLPSSTDAFELEWDVHLSFDGDAVFQGAMLKLLSFEINYERAGAMSQTRIDDLLHRFCHGNQVVLEQTVAAKFVSLPRASVSSNMSSAGSMPRSGSDSLFSTGSLPRRSAAASPTPAPIQAASLSASASTHGTAPAAHASKPSTSVAASATAAAPSSAASALQGPALSLSRPAAPRFNSAPSGLSSLLASATSASSDVGSAVSTSDVATPDHPLDGSNTAQSGSDTNAKTSMSDTMPTDMSVLTSTSTAFEAGVITTSTNANANAKPASGPMNGASVGATSASMATIVPVSASVSAGDLAGPAASTVPPKLATKHDVPITSRLSTSESAAAAIAAAAAAAAATKKKPAKLSFWSSWFGRSSSSAAAPSLD